MVDGSVRRRGIVISNAAARALSRDLSSCFRILYFQIYGLEMDNRIQELDMEMRWVVEELREISCEIERTKKRKFIALKVLLTP